MLNKLSDLLVQNSLALKGLCIRLSENHLEKSPFPEVFRANLERETGKGANTEAVTAD